MDNELLQQMKDESDKKDPMIPRTIRLGGELDQELHDFARKHQINFSAVVRTVMILGWAEFKRR